MSNKITRNELHADIVQNLDKVPILTNNLTTHLADLTYQSAGGSATAITLATTPLIDGYSKTFIASANNNGVTTTINSKLLFKPNTTVAPTLITGKAYTVWYNLAGDCFFIKANAEGTATTAQVLAGVPFSNEIDNGLVGTMPNIGSVGTQKLTYQNHGYYIPQGYHNGNGFVQATYVAGAPTASGTATSTNTGFNISGLSFRPKSITVWRIGNQQSSHWNINRYTSTLTNNNSGMGQELPFANFGTTINNDGCSNFPLVGVATGTVLNYEIYG